jgi:segregation and condensation protein B
MPMTESDQLKPILEAVLLAATQPLSMAQLAAVFDEADMPSHEDIARALERLAADCAGRGIELVEVASGFRYQVREDVHPFVSRLWTERQTRYSRALLETLALIAYRQPVTRGEIEQIRGVGVASSIIRTLEERAWVRVVGYRDVPGKPALLGTTRAFLDYFGLKSLDQLPPLSELRELVDSDPQLSLPAESGDGADAQACPPAIARDMDHAADEEIRQEHGDPATAETRDDEEHPAQTPTPETSA